MIEGQIPAEIIFILPVGDLSSPVHRQMATPDNFQSADGQLRLTQTVCFDCLFLWQTIGSIYGEVSIECPRCSALAGVALSDMDRFTELDH